MGGNVDQAGVIQLAFHLVMAPLQRIGVVMAEIVVKLLVILVGNIALVTSPKRFGGIDSFPLRHFLYLFFALFLSRCVQFEHLDGCRDVIGVLADDRTQLPAIGKLLLIILQKQGDTSTTALLITGLNSELARTIRFPRRRLRLTHL